VGLFFAGRRKNIFHAAPDSPPMEAAGAWSGFCFAMLAPALPKEKIGVMMGMFNLFIVLPQITASTLFGFALKYFLHNDPMNAVVLGGASMGFAALSSWSHSKRPLPNLCSRPAPAPTRLQLSSLHIKCSRFIGSVRRLRITQTPTANHFPVAARIVRSHDRNNSEWA